MLASEISVHPAKVEHSPFLARVILSASRSHLERGPFDLAFQLSDTDVLDVLEWMTLSDAVSSCHFSKFLVAESAGEPVGALSAHDPGETEVLPMAAALADAFSGLGYDEARLAAALERLEATRRCLPPSEPGTWIVEWVSVEKSHRRRKVGSRLLQEVLASGAEQSLHRSQISTYVGNEAAIAAYQSVGFRTEAERRDVDFQSMLGAPGIVTLMREFTARSSNFTTVLAFVFSI